MLTWVLSVFVTLTVCDELIFEGILSFNIRVTAKRHVQSREIWNLLAIPNVDLFASVSATLTIVKFMSISITLTVRVYSKYCLISGNCYMVRLRDQLSQRHA